MKYHARFSPALLNDVPDGHLVAIDTNGTAEICVRIRSQTATHALLAVLKPVPDGVPRFVVIEGNVAALDYGSAWKVDVAPDAAMRPLFAASEINGARSSYGAILDVAGIAWAFLDDAGSGSGTWLNLATLSPEVPNPRGKPLAIAWEWRLFLADGDDVPFFTTKIPHS